MKELLFHQTNRYFGCNLYCIANLMPFTQDEFDKEYNKLKGAPDKLLNDFLENQILRRNCEKRLDNKSDWYFTNIYRIPPIVESYIELPQLFEHQSHHDQPIPSSYIVYLFSIIPLGDYQPDQSALHRIMIIEKMNSPNLYVIDPFYKEIAELSKTEIFRTYKTKAISVLRSESTPFMILMLNHKELEHLID